MSYTDQNRRAPSHPAGESRKAPLRVDFDRRLKLEFHGSKITSNAGFLAYRELDDALGLTDAAGDVFDDSRTGKNGWHGMTGLFRQSVFARLGGYSETGWRSPPRYFPASRSPNTCTSDSLLLLMSSPSILVAAVFAAQGR